MNDFDNHIGEYRANGQYVDSQYVGGGPGGAGEGGGEDEGRLLRVIHASLRGRYPWAIGLGLVLGVGLAIGGWVSTTPMYSATGVIRVESSSPRILFNTDNSGPMRNYENYLKAQANTIRSRRVVEAALQSEEWKPHNQGMTIKAREQFTGRLNAQPQPEIEQIVVRFNHEDPKVAEVATQIVISAYTDLQASIDRERELSRLRVLEELRTSYSQQLTQVRFQIEQVDRALGADGVTAWHRTKVRQYSELEIQNEQLTEMLDSLNKLKQQRDEHFGSDPAAFNNAALATQENPLIKQIDTEIARLNDEITLLIRRLGENHRSIDRARDRITLLEAEKQRLLNEALPQVDPNGSGKPIDMLAVRIKQTKEQLERTKEQSEKTRSELEELAVKLRQIDELRNNEDDLSARLDQTKARINELNIEQSNDRRVEVLSAGEASWRPVNGSQRVARAGIGGMMGFTVGFLVVGLLGLRTKTVTRSDILALDIGDKPLLGLMPELTEKLKDGPVSQSAQASVDHIRSLISLDMNHSHGNCIAITGPQSGSGKTTLAITLALSFAESGSKTLIIDLDVVGGGLSNHVRARRRKRLGEIVSEVAGVDRSEIEEIANRMQQGSGKQLGTYLVEEGIVEQHHVDIALEQQKQEMGVRQALAGAEFEHCTFPSQTQGLDVLPLRTSDDQNRIGRVGPKAIKQLFERAREAYDMVIIDTGPAPGCVETSLAAAAADITVVVVSRNDVRHEVRGCIEFLESIRANIYGYVMNRVESKDMKRSKHSSSFRHASQGIDLRNPVFDEENLGSDHAFQQEPREPQSAH